VSLVSGHATSQPVYSITVPATPTLPFEPIMQCAAITHAAPIVFPDGDTDKAITISCGDSATATTSKIHVLADGANHATPAPR